MTRPTQVPLGSRLNFRLRGCHPLRPAVPSSSANWSIDNSTKRGPTTPQRKTFTVWAAPLSLAATYGIDFSFFSSSYLDVSVHWVGHIHLCIQCMLIRESRDHHSFVNFPKLFADFHALHRLLIPRHPPCALNSLITKIQLSLSLTNPQPKRRRRVATKMEFVAIRTHNPKAAVRCNDYVRVFNINVKVLTKVEL